MFKIEILISFLCLQVVQKGIGHSPQEVTTALSSSDLKKVSDMKEIFRQFQLFLVDFEVRPPRIQYVQSCVCLNFPLNATTFFPPSDFISWKCFVPGHNAYRDERKISSSNCP